MKIKQKIALISVSDKTQLVWLGKMLCENNIKILASGKSLDMLKNAGVDASPVSELSGQNEILDGRVKTLSSQVAAGILAKRVEHLETIEREKLALIDFVIVNLYPFRQVLESGHHSTNEIIENIDIGGPTLIRAAIKNHNDVTVITDPSDYKALAEELSANNGSTTKEFRERLAAKAATTLAIDAVNIANFFERKNDILPESFLQWGEKFEDLRSGENPHQKAAFYIKSKNLPFTAVSGKGMSYNNIVDSESAYSIVYEHSDPACAIIKHGNPCGVALAQTIEQAYSKALSCDPTSSFGGVVAINKVVTSDLARKILDIFTEVVIAPVYEKEAEELLRRKSSLRIVTCNHEIFNKYKNQNAFRSCAGGILVQEQDNSSLPDSVFSNSEYSISEDMKNNLIFAWKVCKYVKSNAIVISSNLKSVGIGAGQMSRIDSVKLAIEKFKLNCPNASDLVLASDGFFPFSDSVIAAINTGVKAIIQPGGSIRDDEVIKAAKSQGIPMFLTGYRAFLH